MVILAIQVQRRLIRYQSHFFVFAIQKLEWPLQLGI